MNLIGWLDPSAPVVCDGDASPPARGAVRKVGGSWERQRIHLRRDLTPRRQRSARERYPGPDLLLRLGTSRACAY